MSFLIPTPLWTTLEHQFRVLMHCRRQAFLRYLLAERVPTFFTYSPRSIQHQRDVSNIGRETIVRTEMDDDQLDKSLIYHQCRGKSSTLSGSRGALNRKDFTKSLNAFSIVEVSRSGAVTWSEMFKRGSS